ncbi:hypothetical protein [Cypionkella sp.]|uniref:hypothetical protein n=1 Tax=Cypionkella sp. TaxID=2811411 RepID=UPI002AB8C9D2|nr:hypothetical protein [Cypionkella sp.]MDZ4393781.1 hypothetical protein [Cypionkella sp.]
MTAPAYLDLEAEIRDLFAAKIREFAAFCAENWLLSEKDMSELEVKSDHPEAYRQGFNAAITDGLTGALDCWIDEQGYS